MKSLICWEVEVGGRARGLEWAWPDKSLACSSIGSRSCTTCSGSGGCCADAVASFVTARANCNPPVEPPSRPSPLAPFSPPFRVFQGGKKNPGTLTFQRPHLVLVLVLAVDSFALVGFCESRVRFTFRLIAFLALFSFSRFLDRLF